MKTSGNLCSVPPALSESCRGLRLMTRSLLWGVVGGGLHRRRAGGIRSANRAPTPKSSLKERPDFLEEKFPGTK